MSESIEQISHEKVVEEKESEVWNLEGSEEDIINYCSSNGRHLHINGDLEEALTVRTKYPVPGHVIDDSFDSKLSTTPVLKSLGSIQAQDFANELGLAESLEALRRPIQLQRPVFYFEVTFHEVLLLGLDGDRQQPSTPPVISLGLVPSHALAGTGGPYPFAHGKMPGDLEGSVGYWSTGEAVLSDSRQQYGPGFGQLDTVGMGWELSGRNQVFFTLNGQMLGPAIEGFSPIGQGDVYPAVGIKEGTVIFHAEANFGSLDFVFETVKEAFLSFEGDYEIDDDEMEEKEDSGTGLLGAFGRFGRSLLPLVRRATSSSMLTNSPYMETLGFVEEADLAEALALSASENTDPAKFKLHLCDQSRTDTSEGPNISDDELDYLEQCVAQWQDVLSGLEKAKSNVPLKETSPIISSFSFDSQLSDSGVDGWDLVDTRGGNEGSKCDGITVQTDEYLDMVRTLWVKCQATQQWLIQLIEALGQPEASSPIINRGQPETKAPKLMVGASMQMTKLERLLVLNDHINRLTESLDLAYNMAYGGQESPQHGPAVLPLPDLGLRTTSSHQNSDPSIAAQDFTARWQQNIMSMICGIQSSLRAERWAAADQLAQLTLDDSPEAIETRMEIIAAGGLHSLLRMVAEAQEQPEVEYAAARAIAHLIPGVNDASMLSSNARKLLEVLRLLLLKCTSKQPKRETKSGKVLELEKAQPKGIQLEASSGDDIITHSPLKEEIPDAANPKWPPKELAQAPLVPEDLPSVSPPMQLHHSLSSCSSAKHSRASFTASFTVEDVSETRRVVAIAVAHMAIALQHQWGEDRTGSAEPFAVMPSRRQAQQGTNTTHIVAGMISLILLVCRANPELESPLSGVSEVKQTMDMLLKKMDNEGQSPPISARETPKANPQILKLPRGSPGTLDHRVSVGSAFAREENHAMGNGQQDTDLDLLNDDEDMAKEMTVLEVDDATLYAALGLAALSHVEAAKPQLVREGGFDLLKDWLQSGHTELSRHAMQIVASLCARPQQLGHQHTLNSGAEGSVYTCGWLDSRLLGSGLLEVMLPLASSKGCGTQTEDIFMKLASCLANLSTHPENRSHIVTAGGIPALSFLLKTACTNLDNLMLLAKDCLRALHNLSLGCPQLSIGECGGVDIVVKGIVQNGLVGLLVVSASFVTMPKQEPLRLLSLRLLALVSEWNEYHCHLWEDGTIHALLCVVRELIGSSPHLAGLIEDVTGEPTQDRAMQSEELLRLAFTLANLTEDMGDVKSPTQADLSLARGPSSSGSFNEQKRLKGFSTMQKNEELSSKKIPHASTQETFSLLDSFLLLVKSPANEVVHQAMKGIANLTSSLGCDSGHPEVSERWAARMLRAALLHLNSPHPLAQYEAFRCVSQLAASQVEGVQTAIVDICLSDLLGIVLDPSANIELQGVANAALVALGFEGGPSDLGICGNDAQLLREWFHMKQTLKAIPVVWDQIGHTVLSNWVGSEGAGAQPLEKSGFKSAEDLLPIKLFRNKTESQTSFPADRGRRPVEVIKGVLRRAVSGNIDPDKNPGGFNLWKPWLQPSESPPPSLPLSRSPSPVLSFDHDNFFPPGCSPIPQSSSLLSFAARARSVAGGKALYRKFQEYTGANVLDEHEEMLCLEIHKSMGLSQHESTGFLSDDEQMDISNASDTDKSKGSISLLSFSNPGELPGHLQEILESWIPSKLEQGCLLSWVPQVKLKSLQVPLHRTNVITLPARDYYSFRREGRVLARLIEDHPVAITELEEEGPQWTLAFRSSSFAGEFADALIQTLHRNPQITSLSFKGHGQCRPQAGDTTLARLAGDLPPSVRWLTFDGGAGPNPVLTRRACEMMGILLKAAATRSNPLAALGPDGEPVTHMMLRGLAIRNHPNLKLGDFSSLLELFQAEKKALARGNAAQKKRDPEQLKTGSEEFEQKESVEKSPLPQQIKERKIGYGLEYLDLSGNKLGDHIATAVMEAVNECPSLTALDLSSNEIRKGSFMTEMLQSKSSCFSNLRVCLLNDNHLSHTVTMYLLQVLGPSRRLKVLGLKGNGYYKDGLAKAFRKFLNENKSLTSLDLRNNLLSDGAAKDLFFGLLGNQKVFYTLLSGNRGLSMSALDEINHQLEHNRKVHLSLRQQWLERRKKGCAASKTHRRCCSLDSGASAKKKKGQNTSPHPSRSRESSPHRSSCSSFPSPEELQMESDSDSYSNDLKSTQIHPLKKRKHAKFKQQTQLHDLAVSTSPLLIPSVGAEPVKDATNEEKPSHYRDALCVLFSEPLVGRVNGRLHPLDLLDFTSEREVLLQCFREAGPDVSLKFDFSTTERLRTHVTLGCRALHYSGHGHRDGLTFEDGQGGLQFVSHSTLMELCGAGGNLTQKDAKGRRRAGLDFVFVSACYSARAGEAFVNAGVPHVVCVHIDERLMDTAAIAFMRAFYLALVVGNTVSAAFEIGRQGVASSPSVPSSVRAGYGDKFLLLPSDADHNVPIFTAPRSIPRWPSHRTGNLSPMAVGGTAANAHLDQSHLPPVPEDFLGRQVEMYQVISTVLKRRLVNLHGLAGIGKSAVAAAVCNYMGQRGLFTIYYVRLQGKRTVEELCEALLEAFHQAVSSRRLPNFSSTSEPMKPADFVSGMMAEKSNIASNQRLLADRVFMMLKPMQKCLLVLDHVENLQRHENGADFRLFLGQLFDHAKYVKVLVTSECPSLFSGTSLMTLSVKETDILLKPLSLKNTLRLFARLCPHLHTAVERGKFVKTLFWDKNSDSFRTASSQALGEAQNKRVLRELGGGHPGKIIQMAYQIDEQEFVRLVQTFDNIDHEEQQLNNQQYSHGTGNLMVSSSSHFSTYQRMHDHRGAGNSTIDLQLGKNHYKGAHKNDQQVKVQEQQHPPSTSPPHIIQMTSRKSAAINRKSKGPHAHSNNESIFQDKTTPSHEIKHVQSDSGDEDDMPH